MLNNQSTAKNHRFKTRKAIVILAVAVVLVVGFALFVRHHNTPEKVSVITTSKAGNESKSASNSSKQSDVSDKVQVSNSNQTSTNQTAALTAPFGSFVSNHAPGKDDSPSQEQSVCNTTAGATCYIRFTKDDLTRTLATQTTNSSGVTSWSWDVRDNLTSGSWQVTAVASLNGKTLSTEDLVKLVVQ